MGMEEDKEVAVTPSTEDVVQALLDYFVEPVLPPKRFFESPSLDQQLSVAKQVHAVVLMYNYYQRMRQPHLQFLDLVSFCKLVVVLKPALMPFMKLMHRSDYSQLDDLKNQLSPTEKAIMDACEVCRILGASKYIPGIDRWPITKVAVLVIDSSMENCLLLHGTATQGVWSVIEKDLDVSNIRSEGTVEAKHINRKRRTFKQPQRYNQSIDASGLRQLALLAVKEVAGINQSNIKVLESHVVYSLSKEMAAACFYVMQCTQSTGQGFQVPIKDVVERLQGPLVKKTSNGWIVSPVAEYFQLFPYAGILSDLISRALLVNHSHVHRATYSPNQVDALNHGEVTGLPLHGSQNKDRNPSFENMVEVHQQMTNVSSSESSKGVSKVGTRRKVDSVKLGTTGCTDEDVVSGSQISTMPSSSHGGNLGRGCEPVLSQSISQHHENLRATFASNERISLDPALIALVREREELFLQKHNVENEIALCDKTIQTILNGGRDSLALMIDIIMEACNRSLREAQVRDRYNQQFEGQGLFQNVERKRLSEAVLTFGSPCQKLDQICHMNEWVLPTYSVILSDGGFQSTVTLKGVDFEASARGDVRSGCPREARDSAAAYMIAKLQEMKNQLKMGEGCSGSVKQEPSC